MAAVSQDYPVSVSKPSANYAQPYPPTHVDSSDVATLNHQKEEDQAQQAAKNQPGDLRRSPVLSNRWMSQGRGCGE